MTKNDVKNGLKNICKNERKIILCTFPASKSTQIEKVARIYAVSERLSLKAIV